MVACKVLVKFWAGEQSMTQSITHIALPAKDYDEALWFYGGKLDFAVLEDTNQAEQDKRRVVIAPPGSAGGRHCCWHVPPMKNRRPS